ncbi:hypothetical protein HBI37_038350 [Parastagonospora nodorum]|nr:hypothetical protein HBI37_038350 [Parastagonospora nodorum]KAH6356327.1 hypothetical protein HBI36_083560 [Parastagonospora nodorum]
MFYSHEILTSRKYGVATVWLVATLGSKSSLKRINRKQILDVDVAKACQTIVDPVAPMALRLQGNLLYGVSRVYLQQCGYVLSDAQNAHNTMVLMLRTVQNHALDLDAGKARPEQLVLQDDPSFLPDFALPPPEVLADLDLGLDFIVSRSGDSQSLTPFGSQQTQSSPNAGALGGLVLPTSSPDGPGGFQFQSGDEAAGTTSFVGGDDGFDIGEPDFGFDENGELIEGPLVMPPVAGTPAARSAAGMHSDAGASTKVRKEHEEGRMGGAQIPDDHMNLGLPIYDEELPDGEAFPTDNQELGSDQAEIVQSSSATSAAMRKKRAPRVLPVDKRMELRNKDLVEWNTNYLKNMDAVIKGKKKSRIAQQAKKGADYYVWGRGLGGIAEHYAGATGPNPFEMFIGDNLFELATGVSRNKVAGKKHDRDSGIDEATQEESRRVRQKTNEPGSEMGRGQDDEGFFMPGDDEVEMPRDAPPALDDQQILSSMPWNTGSKRGSSAIPRSGRPGSRPGSRLVSASPLHGRGERLDLGALGLPESDADFAMGGDEFGMAGPSSPPTLIPSPKDQKPSTHINNALDTEGNNFLEFVTDTILDKRNRAQVALGHMASLQQVQAAANIDTLTFEELLPPVENTKVIACQGLMMVLTLGTKGMLDVQQRTDFGDINVKLTEQAKATQVVEISDDEDSEDEESSDGGVEIMEDMVVGEQGGDEGHFENQFAAGYAEYGEDDHDELYDD